MKRFFLGLVKFILGLVFFLASAVFVVLLVLGLWFINQDDHRKNEIDEKKSQSTAKANADEEKNELKVNVSKLPSDDQQELKKIKVSERTISKDDGKILQGIKYLNFVDNVQAEMDSMTVQPICQIICDSSWLDRQRLSADPYIYLEKFYLQNRNRALEDFYFRHALESTKVVAEVLTPSMRELYIQGLDIENKNYLEQAAYVAKFQFSVAEVLYNISQLNKNFQNYEMKMEKLSELRRTCQYTSAKKVQQSCFDVLASSEAPVLDPKVLKEATVQASSDLQMAETEITKTPTTEEAKSSPVEELDLSE